MLLIRPLQFWLSLLHAFSLSVMFIPSACLLRCSLLLYASPSCNCNSIVLYHIHCRMHSYSPIREDHRRNTGLPHATFITCLLSLTPVHHAVYIDLSSPYPATMQCNLRLHHLAPVCCHFWHASPLNRCSHSADSHYGLSAMCICIHGIVYEWEDTGPHSSGILPKSNTHGSPRGE